MANISEDERKRAWQAGFVFSATIVKEGGGYFKIGPFLIHGEGATVMVNRNILERIQNRGTESQIEFQKGVMAGRGFGEKHTPNTSRPLPSGLNVRKLLFGNS